MLRRMEVAGALYSSIFNHVVRVSTPAAAEMTKPLENIYRCVNIALVNELKLLCLRMGLGIWEVIDAASTMPFGFQAFYAGPGLGGHCILADPFYLAWSQGVPLRDPFHPVGGRHSQCYAGHEKFEYCSAADVPLLSPRAEEKLSTTWPNAYRTTRQCGWTAKGVAIRHLTAEPAHRPEERNGARFAACAE